MKEISIYSFHKYHFLRLEMIVTYKRLSVTGGQSMTTVNESYKYCHQIMKKHSKSFLMRLTYYQKVRGVLSGQYTRFVEL